ncbi:MAG: hypothetical protein HP041_01195 [Oscillospiraceae bacterium]|nr:hypothetical protein [Oscillospiraceae bacterium]
MDILTVASILVPAVLLVVALLRPVPPRSLYALAACLLLGGLVFVLSGAWVSLGVFVLNFGRAGLCLAGFGLLLAAAGFLRDAGQSRK